MDVLLAAILLAVAAPAAPASYPDPIGPAERGQMQCYSPDVSRKTCQSMASYAKGAGGGYENTAVVLIAPDPLITMTSRTTVTLRNAAVCGKIDPAELQSATFEISGQPASQEKTDALRQAVSKAMTPMLDQEICTTYERAGALLTAHATVAGQRRPGMDIKVLWVSPADGYRVAP